MDSSGVSALEHNDILSIPFTTKYHLGVIDKVRNFAWRIGYVTGHVFVLTEHKVV